MTEFVNLTRFNCRSWPQYTSALKRVFYFNDMAKKSTYSKKILDPRWQKRRLEIMQRDNFKCRVCGCEHIELNVHHILYKKDNPEPWDYEEYSLITLCKNCHEEEHYSLDNDIEKTALALIKLLMLTSNNPLISFLKHIRDYTQKAEFDEKDFINDFIKLIKP